MDPYLVNQGNHYPESMRISSTVHVLDKHSISISITEYIVGAWQDAFLCLLNNFYSSQNLETICAASANYFLKSIHHNGTF